MNNVNQPIDLRILKIKSCPSRTGQSLLCYHIGCNEDGLLSFRIHGNSGNGFFNTSWVSLLDIESTLDVSGAYFTSYALKPLYDKRSTNSPGFLLAALLEEGLVKIAITQKRCYIKGNFSAFKDAMQSLIDGKTELDPNQKPPKITKRKQALNDDAVIDQLVHS